MNLEDILAQISALSDEDKAKLLATLKPAEDENTEVEKEVAKDEEKAVATDMEKEVAKDEDKTVAKDEEKTDEAIVNKIISVVAEIKEIANEIEQATGKGIPSVAMDSKAKLVAYGLDTLKVKTKKGEELATLRGYLQHKRADKYEPIVTQDSVISKSLNVWGGR